MEQKTADISAQKKSGCGLLNAVFGRKTVKTRRSTSTGSLQRHNAASNHVTRNTSTPVSRSRRNGLDEGNLDSPNARKGDRIVARPAPNHPKSLTMHQQQQQLKSHAAKKETSGQQGYNPARKVPQPGLGLSGELEQMINDHQKSKGAGNLVRASSGNVMLLGSLGNLRQPQPGRNGTNAANYGNGNVVGGGRVKSPKTAKQQPVPANGRYPISVIGNVVKKNEEVKKPVSLCRALSTRMDPEELKILGNEDYKNGRFAEAVALYDAAISIDPNKASYRSNKGAALTALGKLLEAAFECREAIRIEPFYQRAHNRLATLYVRLGEAEKAVYHFKQSGPEADPDAMNKAKTVQGHLNKCTEAKRQKDWITLLKETGRAIEAGADSAPLIFGLKTEALLKLNRQQEAIETMASGPNFDPDDCIKFFGPIGSASLLLYRAQVHMVAGRFDDAVVEARRASSLDPNKEANMVLKRTKAVATARSNGNELFKAARYAEACIAYGEGLSHDPSNAVLLCNRAACRTKLGHYQKAVEDCTAVLNVRSGYSKARLRRADCYAKMEDWGACIKDCEMLIKESPDDEDVQKILNEATSCLRRSRGSQEMNLSSSHAAGTTVEFCRKPGDKNVAQMMEKLCQRYPLV